MKSVYKSIFNPPIVMYKIVTPAANKKASLRLIPINTDAKDASAIACVPNTEIIINICNIMLE